MPMQQSSLGEPLTRCAKVPILSPTQPGAPLPTGSHTSLLSSCTPPKPLLQFLPPSLPLSSPSGSSLGPI